MNRLASNSVCYFVGLDLGPLAEFTGLAVIERAIVGPNAAYWQRRPDHAVRHLKRFPPGTPYPEIVEDIRRLCSRPPIAQSLLIVDQTGVGQSVTNWFADQLRGKMDATYFPVNITAGHATTMNESGTYQIPKKELAGSVQVLLQSRRLHIARSLADAGMLVKELENFKVKVTTLQDNPIENWREGDHDDLVLAVALAAHVSEATLPTLQQEKIDTQVYYIA
jgi:hypothetical protein